MHVNASTSFELKDKLELDVDVKNWDWQFKIPSIEYNVDVLATVQGGIQWNWARNQLTLSPGYGVQDPCTDPSLPKDKQTNVCDIPLTDPITIFTKAFVVGPVPFVVSLTTEHYMRVKPTFEGSMAAKVHTWLEKPLRLTTPANLAVSKLKTDANGKLDASSEEEVRRAAGNIFRDASDIRNDIAENLVVRISGEVAATTKVQVCYGVKVRLNVNDFEVTMDAPYCFSVKLEGTLKGGLLLGGGNLRGGSTKYKYPSSPFEAGLEASFVLDPLDIVFETKLPEIQGLTEHGCEAAAGAYRFATNPLLVTSSRFLGGSMDQCFNPMGRCVEGAIRDTCGLVSDLVNAVGPVHSFNLRKLRQRLAGANELWKHTYSYAAPAREEAGLELSKLLAQFRRDRQVVAAPACADQTLSPSGAPWHDTDGSAYGCDWYSEGRRCEQHGNGFANGGLTANQACCACQKTTAGRLTGSSMAGVEPKVGMVVSGGTASVWSPASSGIWTDEHAQEESGAIWN